MHQGRVGMGKQFAVVMVATFLRIVVTMEMDEGIMNLMYVKENFRWPAVSVGPYDWKYYRVEIPHGTEKMEISFEKKHWQNQETQPGPLACFKRGGPMVPSEPIGDIPSAAQHSFSTLHPPNGKGVCSWISESTNFTLSNIGHLPGIWVVGIFSLVNESRTQSQMIPRGPIYNLAIGIDIWDCKAGHILLCPNCTCDGPRPTELSHEFWWSESENTSEASNSNMQTHYGGLGGANSPLPNQCFKTNETWKFYSLKVTGNVFSMNATVIPEATGSLPSTGSPLIIFAKLGSLPGENDTVSWPVFHPEHGTWYFGLSAAGNVAGIDAPPCFTLKWELVACFLGDLSCEWPVHPLERIVPLSPIESSLDASYIPASFPAPDSLLASWFTYEFNSSFRVSPASNMSAIYANSIEGISEQKDNSSNASTVSHALQEAWVYFSMSVPTAMSGSVLTVDLLPALQALPASNSSSTAATQLSSVFGSIEVYGRFQGLPSSSKFDVKSNVTELLLAPASSSFPFSGASPEIGVGFSKMVTVNVIYPAEGIWFFALRAQKLGSSMQWTDKEPKLAVQLRFWSHGCLNSCNWHGGCNVMMDGSHTQEIGYCYCDRTHGGFDCSLEMLSQKAENQHIFALVFSNIAAVLPAAWSIQNRAYAEWVVYTCSGVSSAVYHWCDAGGWCSAQYHTLQFADFFLSFLAVVTTFIFLADLPPPSKNALLISFAIVDAIIAADRATSGKNIYIVSGMGMFALLLGWVLDVASRRQHWQSQADVSRSSDGYFRWQHWGVEQWTLLKLWVGKFNATYVILGALALLLAKLNWFFETASTYWIWHSLWHVSIYSSAFFFLLAMDVGHNSTRTYIPVVGHDSPGVMLPMVEVEPQDPKDVSYSREVDVDSRVL